MNDGRSYDSTSQLVRSVRRETKQTQKLRSILRIGPKTSMAVGLAALGLILRDRLVLALGQRPS